MTRRAVLAAGGRRSRAGRLTRLVVVLCVVICGGLVLALGWPDLLRALTDDRPADRVTSRPVTDAPADDPGLLHSSAAAVTKARKQLGKLEVVPRPKLAEDYRRAKFGEAWTDTDGNGCNQRDDVLLRDVLTSQPYTTARQHACDHDMLAGTWLDPYTGASITLTDAKQPDQAQSVQIDHIVALSVAWRYGADSWSDGKRLKFANDLRNLVAVGGEANQAKGGSDAAQWRPITAAQCGYAVRYVTVKQAYALPVDSREKRALADMLATCP